MQFVYPSFLFALSAIAIPIIIHLFNFRRYKKIIFSDIRFLKQVQEETKSKRKIKELLILLSRILAITCLVLAFAQPFLPLKETKQLAAQKAISIYIDNSFSMGNEGKNGILLETAKNKAQAIINGYGNDVTFQILTSDFEAKQQRLLSKNDALQSIDQIKLSSSSKLLSSVIKRQKQAFENQSQKNQISYIVSDFQKNFTDIEQVKNDSTLSLNFVPVQANIDHNIFIDSAWFLSPIIRINSPIQLKIRIRNTSNDNLENIAITLKVNASQKALVNVNCTAHSFADAEMTFTLNSAGTFEGELSLIDHPISFDDKLFFTITTSTSNQILCINGKEENPFIKKIFEGDDSYLLSNCNENKIDYASFSNKKLLILNEPNSLSSGLSSELKKYLETGGYVLIIPPQQIKTTDLNAFLSELNCINFGIQTKQQLKVDHINTQEAVFKDVFQKLSHSIDLPTVAQYYETVKNTSTRGVSLMLLNNGMPFIFQSAIKKGKLFLLTTPLNIDWSNLPQHSVFVPLMLKLAQGNASFLNCYSVIDKDKWISSTIDWQGTEKTAHIKGNGIDFLADVKLQDGKNNVFIDQQIKKAGIYQLEMKDNNKGVQIFAMNYNRAESYTQTFDASELTKNIKAEILNDDATVIRQKISQELNGTQLWRVCLMLCLLFVLIEILLLKLL
jgi:hypothetical protein